MLCYTESFIPSNSSTTPSVDLVIMSSLCLMVEKLLSNRGKEISYRLIYIHTVTYMEKLPLCADLNSSKD